MNWSSLIQNIVTDYQEHIKENYNKNFQKKFNDLFTKNNEEAAISEAIIFNWLCQNNLNPEIKESKSNGGADFLCNYGKSYQFIVEVSCLTKDALTKGTGLREEGNMALTPASAMLRKKISSKVKQISPYQMPRVLAITSLHVNANLLLGIDGATNCLVSNWGLSIPLDSSSQHYLSTDLQESIFIRRVNKTDKPLLENCREAVSAILLIPITENRLNVTGILHHKPNYNLDILVFPKVPFIKIKNIQDNKIFTEWVIGEPYVALYPLDANILK